MNWVKQQREELKEKWSNGHYTAAFDTEMIAKNAGATGACSAYQEILELTYDQLTDDQ